MLGVIQDLVSVQWSRLWAVTLSRCLFHPSSLVKSKAYKNQHYCSRRDRASVHTTQKKVIETHFFCKGEKTHNADL